jgi:hypothetical protein
LASCSKKKKALHNASGRLAVYLVLSFAVEKARTGYGKAFHSLLSQPNALMGLPFVMYIMAMLERVYEVWDKSEGRFSLVETIATHHTSVVSFISQL